MEAGSDLKDKRVFINFMKRFSVFSHFQIQGPIYQDKPIPAILCSTTLCAVFLIV